MNKKFKLMLVFFHMSVALLIAQKDYYAEQYRLQVHFSPEQKWMNDPNGMVYFNGTYHMFYQYYPDGTVWGPMHWGHAISKDLMHWKQLPIALYPDSLGYIYSGSAVVDSNNTSGFGSGGKIPLVAIYTSHNAKLEKEGKDNYEAQSIAYSLDEGKTWTKYKGNPVIKNPGIKDFRDPKVIWVASVKRWIMALATQDRVTFYSSADLKNWTRESEFGNTIGAHGGVWECPDLFPLTLKGKIYWVLFVSIGSGAPNKGSATQYFIGQFDGKSFTAQDTVTRWIDHGTDNYAGVTWSNTGARRIFLGWMSNWSYAFATPTVRWRSSMTIPRELSLIESGNTVLLGSNPVKELDGLTVKKTKIPVVKQTDLSSILDKAPAYVLSMDLDEVNDFALTFANSAGEKMIFGYEATSKKYYIDRQQSGGNLETKYFYQTMFSPRVSKSQSANITILVDAASIEVFADNGASVLTSLVFPQKLYDQLSIQNEKGMLIKSLEVKTLKSIWK